MQKMNKVTKSFGQLCKIFFEKSCQKICTIKIFVVLLHPISMNYRK